MVASPAPARRQDPKPSALTVDLCDHFHYAQGHRCQNYWRFEIFLDVPVQVKHPTMGGEYHPGIWRFCSIHHRIFMQRRTDLLPKKEN